MKRAKVPIEYQSKLLKRIDKTKDATISREEFYKYAENQLSKLRKTFDDLDINHDGQLNREEVMLALKNYEFSQQSLMIDKFFRTIDKNCK